MVDYNALYTKMTTEESEKEVALKRHENAFNMARRIFLAEVVFKEADKIVASLNSVAALKSKGWTFEAWNADSQASVQLIKDGKTRSQAAFEASTSTRVNPHAEFFLTALPGSAYHFVPGRTAFTTVYCYVWGGGKADVISEQEFAKRILEATKYD